MEYICVGLSLQSLMLLGMTPSLKWLRRDIDRDSRRINVELEIFEREDNNKMEYIRVDLHEKVDMAMRLWEDMVVKGFGFLSLVSDVLLDVLCDFAKVNEAEKCLLEMAEK